MNCGGMFFGNGSTCGGGSPGCGGNRITRQTSGFASNSCGVVYTTVSCGGGGCSAMRERRSARLRREEEQREAERRQQEVLSQGRIPDEDKVTGSMWKNASDFDGTSKCVDLELDLSGSMSHGGSCGSGGGCGSSNGCGGNNSSLVDRFNQRRRGF